MNDTKQTADEAGVRQALARWRGRTDLPALGDLRYEHLDRGLGRWTRRQVLAVVMTDLGYPRWLCRAVCGRPRVRS